MVVAGLLLTAGCGKNEPEKTIDDKPAPKLSMKGETCSRAADCDGDLRCNEGKCVDTTEFCETPCQRTGKCKYSSGSCWSTGYSDCINAERCTTDHECFFHPSQSEFLGFCSRRLSSPNEHFVATMYLNGAIDFEREWLQAQIKSKGVIAQRYAALVAKGRHPDDALDDLIPQHLFELADWAIKQGKRSNYKWETEYRLVWRGEEHMWRLSPGDQ